MVFPVAEPAAAAAAARAGVVFELADSAADFVAVAAVEPGVASVAVVFAVLVSAVDASGLRGFVDTALASVVLPPVSAVAVEAGSSGRPRFHVFPNTGCFSSPASSV